MSRSTTFVSLADIRAARDTISDRIRCTPVNNSADLTQRFGVPVYLKLEHLQITGSFKLRGAINAVTSLSDKDKLNGVVGVSTGNHGRALAYAARAEGVRCVVCMSGLVPQEKIDGIKSLGAEVRIVGGSQDEAQEEVDHLVSKERMTMIPPFDNRAVIAGQGTLGLELAEQVPDAETVLVPLSGGGLISGVSAALKAQNPRIRIVGISMERGAAMHESQRAGKPVMVEELATLADSLGGGVGIDNKFTFAMTRELVDKIVLVSEKEIAEAVRHIYWHDRQVIEGSGSVGVAAILANKVKGSGPVVAILSGGNIDMDQHHRIISGEDVDVTMEPERNG